jgi:hypothetical protein
VKTGPSYLVQISLVQIHGMSIFMKYEDMVLKFGFDFGFVSFGFVLIGFVSFPLVSFRFDFVCTLQVPYFSMYLDLDPFFDEISCIVGVFLPFKSLCLLNYSISKKIHPFCFLVILHV